MIIDKQMEIVEGMNQDYIAAHALPERKDLARFIREGAQDALWGDEITSNMAASG
jgi:hypothetical protein